MTSVADIPPDTVTNVESNLYTGRSLLDYVSIPSKPNKLYVQKRKAVATYSRVDYEEIQAEYDVLTKLQCDNVVHVLGLVQNENHSAIVMDVGGVTLRQFTEYYVQDQKPGALPTEVFHKIAVQMCVAVERLHQIRCIHRDLSPDNFLIDKESFLVKLTDFNSVRDISDPSNKGAFNLMDPSRRFLTSPYVAPEVAGATDHDVGYRSDLYSLGAVFWHLLVGKAPFFHREPQALLDMIKSEPPARVVDLAQRAPNSLGEIVKALMEKSPDDRLYNSVHALISDLETSQFCATRETFKLAQKRNVYPHLSFKPKLYGQATIIRELHAVVRSMLSSSFTFASIRGPQGVGKTAVAREALQDYLNDKCTFMYGRCSELRYGMPYSAIDSAFSDMISRWSEEEIALWRKRIDDDMGNSALVVSQAFPSLQRLLGTSDDDRPHRLPASQRYGRFSLACCELFGLFSNYELPMVLVIDDAQYLDKDTVKLITELGMAGIHMLVFVVYKDDKCTTTCEEHNHRGSSEHEIAQMILNFKRNFSHYPISEFHIAPMGKDGILALLTDTLHTTQKESEFFCTWISDKTKGNIVYIRHLLQYLYIEGFFTFDADRQNWRLQEERLMGVDEDMVPEEAAKFIAQVIDGWAPACRELMSTAAYMGSKINLKDVAAMAIDAQAGMTIPFTRDMIRRPEGKSEPDDIEFSHELVKNAAASLRPDAEGKYVSNRFVWSFDFEALRSDPSLLFHVLGLANSGSDLISNHSDKDDEKVLTLFRLNVYAGSRAKEVDAYSKAVDCFNQASSLMSGNMWMDDYEHALILHLDWVESSYLLGDVTEAERVYRIIEQKVTERDDLYKACFLRARLYHSSAKYNEAVQTSLACLETYGLQIAQNPLESEIDAAVEELVNSNPGNIISTLAESKDPDLERIMDLMFFIASTCHLSHHYLLQDLLPMKALGYMKERGFSKHGCGLLAMLGFVLVRCGKPKLGHAMAAQAQALAPRENPHVRSVALLYYGLCVQWGEPMQRCEDVYIECRQCYLQVFDILNLSYSTSQCLMAMMHISVNLLELQNLYVRIVKMARQIRGPLSIEIALASPQLVVSSLRSLKSAHPLIDGRVQEFERDDLPQLEAFAQANYYTCRVMECFFLKRHAEAVKHIEKGNAVAKSIECTHCWYLFHIFACMVLATATRYSQKSQRDYLVSLLKSHLEVVSSWSEHSEENFEHTRLLCWTHYRWAEGDGLATLKDYEVVANQAKRCGHSHFAAIALECGGQVAEDYDMPLVAVGYYQLAGAEYKEWGAVKKVEEMGYKCSKIARNSPFAHNLAGRSEISSLAETIADESEEGDDPIDSAAEHPSPVPSQPVAPTPAVVGPAPTTGEDGTADVPPAAGADLTGFLRVGRKGNEIGDQQLLLRSAQALAKELDLKSLITKTMKVFMNTSAATRLVLLFVSGHDAEGISELDIHSEAVYDQTEISLKNFEKKKINLRDKTLLDEYAFVSLTAMRSVCQSRGTWLLNEVESDLRLASDDYIAVHHPKAMACLPVKNKGEIICLVYCENDVQAGVFTPGRLGSMQALATQVAICLDNAKIYSDMRSASEASRKFVPLKLMELVGCSEVSELRGNPGVDVTMTILYVDLRWLLEGRGTLSASDLFGVYDKYLQTFTECVTKHGGIMDRLSTDCAVAMFPKSVSAAIRAMSDLQKSVEALNRSRMEADEPYKLYCTAHHGPLRIGFLGSDQRMESGIIGDVMQQSAVVTGLASVVKSSLLLTEAVVKTLEETSDEKVHSRWLATVCAGDRQPVKVYEMLPPFDPLNPDSNREHELREGLEMVAMQLFAEAKAFWFDLKYSNQADAALADFYLQCIDIYDTFEMGEDWQGQIQIDTNGHAQIPPAHYRSARASPPPASLPSFPASGSIIGLGTKSSQQGSVFSNDALSPSVPSHRTPTSTLLRSDSNLWGSGNNLAAARGNIRAIVPYAASTPSKSPSKIQSPWKSIGSPATTVGEEDSVRDGKLPPLRSHWRDRGDTGSREVSPRRISKGYSPHPNQAAMKGAASYDQIITPRRLAAKLHDQSNAMLDDDEIREAFHRFDTAGKGYLNVNEIRTAYRTFDIYGTATDDTAIDRKLGLQQMAGKTPLKNFTLNYDQFAIMMLRLAAL